MTHRARTLSHKCDVVNTCASTDGARRAQNCAIVHVSVLCGVRAIVRNVLQVVHVVREDVRSFAGSQMFVNMRCRIHSLYMARIASVVKMLVLLWAGERKSIFLLLVSDCSTTGSFLEMCRQCPTRLAAPS